MAEAAPDSSSRPADSLQPRESLEATKESAAAAQGSPNAFFVARSATCEDSAESRDVFERELKLLYWAYGILTATAFSVALVE
jgi:hypothetical protein